MFGTIAMAGAALMAVVPPVAGMHDAAQAGGRPPERRPVAPANDVQAPRLVYVFSLFVEVAPPQERGMIDGRQVRFVPITGGRVSGPRLNGTVLSGGGDWQSIHADGLTEVNTRYAMRADDGTAIDIVNVGVRVASAEVTGQIARGEPVDPSAYYFRTSPQFTAPAGAHAWLRRTAFIGVGIRRPSQVEIQVFAVE